MDVRQTELQKKKVTRSQIREIGDYNLLSSNNITKPDES